MSHQHHISKMGHFKCTILFTICTISFLSYYDIGCTMFTHVQHRYIRELGFSWPRISPSLKIDPSISNFGIVNADKKMLRNVQFEVHRNFITSWKLVLQYSIFKKVIGLLMFWIYKAVRLNKALKIINSRKACVCPKFHFQLVTNLPQII